MEKSPRNSANITSNIKLSINNSLKLNINVKFNVKLSYDDGPLSYCVYFVTFADISKANFVKKFGLGENPLHLLGQNPNFLTASKCYKRMIMFFKNLNIFQGVNVECHCDNSKILPFEMSSWYITRT